MFGRVTARTIPSSGAFRVRGGRGQDCSENRAVPRSGVPGLGMFGVPPVRTVPRSSVVSDSACSGVSHGPDHSEFRGVPSSSVLRTRHVRGRLMASDRSEIERRLGLGMFGGVMARTIPSSGPFRVRGGRGQDCSENRAVPRSGRAGSGCSESRGAGFEGVRVGSAAGRDVVVHLPSLFLELGQARLHDVTDADDPHQQIVRHHGQVAVTVLGHQTASGARRCHRVRTCSPACSSRRRRSLRARASPRSAKRRTMSCRTGCRRCGDRRPTRRSAPTPRSRSSAAASDTRASGAIVATVEPLCARIPETLISSTPCEAAFHAVRSPSTDAALSKV